MSAIIQPSTSSRTHSHSAPTFYMSAGMNELPSTQAALFCSSSSISQAWSHLSTHYPLSKKAALRYNFKYNMHSFVYCMRWNSSHSKRPKTKIHPAQSDPSNPFQSKTSIYTQNSFIKKRVHQRSIPHLAIDIDHSLRTNQIHIEPYDIFLSMTTTTIMRDRPLYPLPIPLRIPNFR